MNSCPRCGGKLQTLPVRPHIDEHFYCAEENLILAIVGEVAVPCEDEDAHVLFYPARAGRP